MLQQLYPEARFNLEDPISAILQLFVKSVFIKINKAEISCMCFLSILSCGVFWIYYVVNFF